MKTKFNGFLTLLLALIVQISFAQNKTISGIVSDESGPLPGVSVLKKGTSQGTETDFDGKYTIEVKTGDVLVFSFVGMETAEKKVGVAKTLNVTMKSGNMLEEIVVTGVAKGTSTKKLGFSLSKVNKKLLEEVPAVDAANSLRAKVSGINIVQSQGDGVATVTLRGAKSVFGNVAPLILIDGIITNQELGDINTSDIESIEVIKGAAASSLYGSRAAGGVIQVITKKGKRGATNFSVNLRSEIGFNTLEREFEQNKKHPYKTKNDGTLVLDANGQVVVDSDGKFDGDWSKSGYKIYNPFTVGIRDNTYTDNTLGISGGGENYRYYASAQIQDRGGVLDIVDSETRKTTRANFDFYPNEKLSLGFRASFSNNKYSPIVPFEINSATDNSRGGQGSVFEVLLRYEPIVNIKELGKDGSYLSVPSTAKMMKQDNSSNPYYVFNAKKIEAKSNRFVGGVNLGYKITNNLNLELKGSTDRYYYDRFDYTPKGYKTPTPNADLNDGRISFINTEEQFNAASVQLAYDTNIMKDLKTTFTLKYLVENQLYSNIRQQGSKLTTGGNVYDSGISDTSKRIIDSYKTEINSQNFFLSGDFDYKDKIIISGLVRRDGSSLFGKNKRWQTYYRGSLAYRLTKDVEINNVDELKFRVSYGTAGRRPKFSSQYEIANVSSSGISFRQSGNPNLIPSVNEELEAGIDIEFLKRFNFSFSYSNSTIKNDFVNVNLPAASLFQKQYKNIGAVESNSYEFSLGAKIINKEKFKWEANLTFDKSSSRITSLGGVAPFTAPNEWYTRDYEKIYRIEEGYDVGTIYGNYAVKSIDEVEFDANGYAINVNNLSSKTITKGDLIVNNMGFVVEKSAVGTAKETALYLIDKNTGLKKRVALGNKNPDFKIGLANTLSFGNGFKFYFLLDYKHGGYTYNYTDNYLVYNGRSAKFDEATEKGHHANFIQAAGSLYNGSSANNYFVEKSTYLKIREVALSYTIEGERLGGFIDQLKLGLVGRNLYTFSKYSGFNVEGGIENFSYPLFRTFSGSVTLKF